MEIIKIDSELAECPETGVRYFGYIRAKNLPDSGTGYNWYNVNYSYDLPWFISQEELINQIVSSYPDDRYEIDQVIILKAELPIKKLVMKNG